MSTERLPGEKVAICEGWPSSCVLIPAVETRAAFASRPGPAAVLIDGALDAYPILAANAAFEALTGYPSRELEGRPFFTLTNSGKDGDSAANLKNFMVTSQEGAVQIAAYRKEGTAFPCAIFVRPFIDHASAGSFHVATFLPLAPIPAPEENALISSERVIEFLATMAHELRNPMMPILGQTQMVRKLLLNGETGPRVTRLLERLELSVEVFARRATLLMEVSRIASGGLKLSPVLLDLSQLASEAVARHRAIADALSVPLCLEEGAPVIGMFDRVAVEQIFDNLISNSLKFSNEKPIEIKIGTEGEFAILQVKDNGVGIPADKLAGIFNCFDQGSLTLRSGGFGIGLWVVRHLVEAMKGTVSVNSIIDRGSVFMVKMPLSTEGLNDDR